MIITLFRLPIVVRLLWKRNIYFRHLFVDAGVEQVHLDLIAVRQRYQCARDVLDVAVHHWKVFAGLHHDKLVRLFLVILDNQAPHEHGDLLNLFALGHEDVAVLEYLSLEFEALDQVTLHPDGEVIGVRYRYFQDSERSLNLTDSLVSPLAESADHTLIIKNQGPSFFHSVAAAVAVSEALIALMVAEGGESTLACIEESERQTARFDTYWRKGSK